MIPTIGHSGKGQTMGTIKRSVVAGGGAGERRLGRAQGILRAVKILCMKRNEG